MLIRPVWNDGQAITTPEIQRPGDVGANADDRAFDALMGMRAITPNANATFKRVMPLAEANSVAYAAAGLSVARLAIASSSLISVWPAVFHASTTPDFTTALASEIKMSALLDKVISSPTIASNGGGSTRYDLIYVTVNRTAPADITAPPANGAFAGIGTVNPSTGAQQTRKIKNVTSGNITSQTINIYDVPTITIGVNQGFLTGATPPTNTQIQAALPADTATAYSFAIAYASLASGFTAGTLTQAMVSQCWKAGRIPVTRLDRNHQAALYDSGVSEKPTTKLSERWGGFQSMFFNFYLKSTTGTTRSTGFILDDTLDWRNRMIIILGGYAANADGGLQLGSGSLAPGVLLNNVPVTDTIATCALTGIGGVPATTADIGIIYNGTLNAAYFSVNSSGVLNVYRQGTVIDGTHGDLIVGNILFSDQFIF